jgi:hypothetical protein
MKTFTIEQVRPDEWAIIEHAPHVVAAIIDSASTRDAAEQLAQGWHDRYALIFETYRRQRPHSLTPLLALALLLSAAPAPAASRFWRTMNRISQVAFVAGNAADAHSSYGRQELNPVLAGRDGRFGSRAITIKAGIGAGWLIFQHTTNRHGKRDAPYTVANFAAGTTLGAIARRNYQLPQNLRK